MSKKPIYKCEICGSEHEYLIDRAKCELACGEKMEAEARKAAELKKEAEYAERKAEVDSAFNAAYELKEKFVKDYGFYTYSWKSNISMDPSIWRLFL